MKKRQTSGSVCILLLLLPLTAGARTIQHDRVPIPLTRPGEPVWVEAKVIDGTIAVTGHDGPDVVIEIRLPTADDAAASRRGTEGLRRLPTARSGVTIEEKGNRIRITMDDESDAQLHLRVPRRTSLQLESVNGGELVVEGVRGELELAHTNAGIVARDVEGSVVAHTTNGDITVLLDRVARDAPMSFATLNGDVSVSLPADVEAHVELRSDHGEIFTDFDVSLLASRSDGASERQGATSRFVLRRELRGTINGGGPLIRLRTFNGDLFLRSH